MSRKLERIAERFWDPKRDDPAYGAKNAAERERLLKASEQKGKMGAFLAKMSRRKARPHGV